MELELSLSDLQAKLREHRGVIKTEEAAKTTLVLPFLRALGYDIFDPSEVTPEFTCDVGTKQGEKVDYAIWVEGKPSILIECKAVQSDLSDKHASQLFRYFATTDAKVAILTNGVEYRFYTDGDKINRMDEKPFFSFNLDDYRKTDLKTLAAFQKQEFDLEKIATQAGTLKLQGEVATELKSEFAEPSDQLVRMIAKRLHRGILTEPVRNRFKLVIQQSISAIIRDGVDQRLQNAMSQSSVDQSTDEIVDLSDVETTDDEITGFNIIRAIGSKIVSVDRIVIRDAKSYCAVLLDNNNRRTIARLHFNSETARYLGIFRGKDEERIPVINVSDIFQHSDAIISRIQELDN